MLMVGFQSPGIILWSRHSIGELSCLGGGLHSRSALVIIKTNSKCMEGKVFIFERESSNSQNVWIIKIFILIQGDAHSNINQKRN